MSLKPGLILLVKPPALILERFGRQILLIGVLFVVEDVKKRVSLHALVLVQGWVVENWKDILRVVRWRSIFV